MKTEQIRELLYQALETEQGGIQVYEAAIGCAQNEDLKKEWREYLEQTRNHEQVLLEVFKQMDLDPRLETPGRTIVRHIGQSLVKAMQMAKQAATPVGAQLVAAECVVEAETKDHMNWELIGEVIEHLKAGKERDALRRAHEEVEDQEDEHLYHTMGWARELWLESLGVPAVLPPPEEEKHVKTAIGAARARQSRDDLLGKH
jgi:rubrerythrin